MTKTAEKKIDSEKDIKPISGKCKAAYTQLCGLPAGGGIKVGHLRYLVDDLVEGKVVRNVTETTPNHTFVDDDGITQFVMWGSTEVAGVEYLRNDGEPVGYRGAQLFMPVERVGFQLARERNIGHFIKLMMQADIADGSLKVLKWENLTDTQKADYRRQAKETLALCEPTDKDLLYKPFALLIKEACDAIVAKQQAAEKARAEAEVEAEALFGKKRRVA